MAAFSGKRTKAEVDALWEALVKATGFQPYSKSEQADMGKTVHELLDCDPPVTPEEVPRLARVWREKFEDTVLTHRVFRNNLGVMRGLATPETMTLWEIIYEADDGTWWYDGCRWFSEQSAKQMLEDFIEDSDLPHLRADNTRIVTVVVPK